jgi:hypothetical protein
MALLWPDGRAEAPPKPDVTTHGFRSVSEYGMRWHPVYHDWRLHAGIDLIGLKDGRVKAIAKAKVTIASYFGGYGNLVELTIQSGAYKGWRFRYGHNSKFLVKKNAIVQPGQDLAIWGMTGTATGVHVHFEVIPPGKSQINPRPFMNTANAGAAGGGGTPLPEEETVTPYIRQDADARAKGRVVKPGQGFYLHTTPGLPTDKATNVIGKEGVYDLSAHIYAHGTPGEVVALVAVVQSNPADPAKKKSSRSYTHLFTFDKNGQVADDGTWQFDFAKVAAPTAVYIRAENPASNKGDITVTVLDSAALAFKKA